MVAISPMDLSQSIHAKHTQFFERIRDRKEFCALKDGAIPPPPKNWEQGAMGGMTRYMTKDVRQLFVDYTYRSEVCRSQRDVLNLAMRLSIINTTNVVEDVFMYYVKAFGATDAFCHDDRLGAWSRRSTLEVDKLIKRCIFIRQVNWISNHCAWEELQISSREIGERIAPVAERVEYFPDGVYIVLDSRPLTMAEAKEKTLAANLALYPEIAPIIPDLLAIDA
ncbi:hypothetical protein K2X85_06505 [bacterium]|nr:hypothetical protein [bacterium]